MDDTVQARGFFQKIQHSWQRDGSLPVRERLEKGLRYLAATATAPLYLRGCTRVGPRARTLGCPAVDNAGRLEIGSDVIINSLLGPVELATGPRGALLLGDRLILNYGSSLRAASRVRLGDDVSVGPYCVIWDLELPGAPAGPEEPRPIEIGDRVWLAARVTVLPGARIGEGAVIGAGSVVSGEIPPGVVAGGVPARVLRSLVSPQECPAAAPVATPAGPRLAGTIISDFTAGDLARALSALGTARLEAEVAPAGSVVSSLSRPPAGARDFAVVWTLPQGAIPSFQRVLDGVGVGEETLLAKVDAFCDLLQRGAEAYRVVFVPSWTLPPDVRPGGLRDTQPGGVAWSLAVLNLRLMERLSAVPGVFVLAADRWLAGAPDDGHAGRLWSLGRIPFTRQVFAAAAEEVGAALRGLAAGERAA